MDDVVAAMAEFPELTRLAELHDAGWQFEPVIRDGVVIQVNGLRRWPDGWVDALRVRYVTDAAGLRADHAGGVTWQREGTLTDVVDGLVSLPLPSERTAPRLVIARGPALRESELVR
ncbi:hypothetical protein [Amycolatopsis sp. NPDC059657]|uniref:hypothetical protein n=1 Tax=Amycolatopsis sp. NPDC059657 TaxID=3346899 RepID=UPI003671D29A